VRRVHRKIHCFLKVQMAQKLEIVATAWVLTVTDSTWIRAREDLRTNSTKCPEGGNRGVGRAMAMRAIGWDSVQNGPVSQRQNPVSLVRRG
jgi:hypothetical protein